MSIISCFDKPITAGFTPIITYPPSYPRPESILVETGDGGAAVGKNEHAGVTDFALMLFCLPGLFTRPQRTPRSMDGVDRNEPSVNGSGAPVSDIAFHLGQ